MSRYTNWFPGEVKPVRKGVYERKLSGKTHIYAYWDGKHWRTGSDYLEFAKSEPFISGVQDHWPWRGLKEKAK